MCLSLRSCLTILNASLRNLRYVWKNHHSNRLWKRHYNSKLGALGSNLTLVVESHLRKLLKLCQVSVFSAIKWEWSWGGIFKDLPISKIQWKSISELGFIGLKSILIPLCNEYTFSYELATFVRYPLFKNIPIVVAVLFIINVLLSHENECHPKLGYPQIKPKPSQNYFFNKHVFNS